MPDFPPSYVYTSLPVDAVYHRYSLRCRVEHEQHKAYYWSTIAKIYDAIAPLIAGWADIRLNSDQALERRVGKKIDSDGSFRTTLRHAPTGGLQRLTRERVEQVSTRYLSDNAHLIALFETGRIDARFFTPDHPECVHFFLTELTGSRRRLRFANGQTFRFSPHDFHLCIGGYHHQHRMRADPINQSLDMYLWQGLGPEAELDGLVRQIGALAGARHVWRAESGFMGEAFTNDQGNYTVRYSVEDCYEDAIDGRNRYGSVWTDMLAEP